MDTNIDRIINLLLATAQNEGDIAADLRDEIEAGVVEILSNAELLDAVGEGTTAFVEATIDVTVAAIVAVQGDEALVGSIVGTAYATGLAFGIAIALLAQEAAEA
jgi:hypothetical protein